MKTIAAIAAAAVCAAALVTSASAAEAGARGHNAGSYDVAGPQRCLAVAKRRGGRGANVPGTRNVAFGRGACARAARACRIDLRQRQRRGLNPYAACIVVRHHGRFGRHG